MDIKEDAFYKFIQQYDEKCLDGINSMLDDYKKILQDYINATLDFFQHKQDKLERLFAEAAAVVARVAEHMQDNVGDVRRVHVTWNDGSFAVEVEDADE